MYVSINLHQALNTLSNEKKRQRALARLLRNAADRIEKGEGSIDYTVSIGGRWDGGKVDPYTNLGWASPEEIARRKKDAPAPR